MTQKKPLSIFVFIVREATGRQVQKNGLFQRTVSFSFDGTESVRLIQEYTQDGAEKKLGHQFPKGTVIMKDFKGAIPLAEFLEHAESQFPSDEMFYSEEEDKGSPNPDTVLGWIEKMIDTRIKTKRDRETMRRILKRNDIVV